MSMSWPANTASEREYAAHTGTSVSLQVQARTSSQINGSQPIEIRMRIKRFTWTSIQAENIRLISEPAIN
jgi:hypothetical protein